MTPAQREVLLAMASGHHMTFSQDGDDAWLCPPHHTGFLSDEQTIGLRKLGYIETEREGPHDPEEKYARFGPPTVLTDAGRAALSSPAQGAQEGRTG